MVRELSILSNNRCGIYKGVIPHWWYISAQVVYIRTGGIYAHRWHISAHVVYIRTGCIYKSTLVVRIQPISFNVYIQIAAKKMRGRVLENGSSGYGTGTNYVEEQNLGRYLIVLNYYHMC